MLVPGSLLDLEWLRSNEGSQILNCLLHRNGTRLKQYGLLDHPHLPGQLNVEEVMYKVMLVGKTGVGKTSTVAKLTGADVPLSHNETPGLQTTHLYWPGRIRHLGKTVLFNLHLFDAGEAALKRYDHILPACKDGVDAIMFLFSFVDKGSFDEIPQLITRLMNSDDGVSKIVLGTKHSPITGVNLHFKAPAEDKLGLCFCDVFTSRPSKEVVSFLGTLHQLYSERPIPDPHSYHWQELPQINRQFKQSEEFSVSTPTNPGLEVAPLGWLIC